MLSCKGAEGCKWPFIGVDYLLLCFCFCTSTPYYVGGVTRLDTGQQAGRYLGTLLGEPRAGRLGGTKLARGAGWWSP